MRKDSFILLFSSFLSLSVYNCMGAGQKINPSASKCRLNWFEVSKGRFSTQLMFDFSKSFYFEKKLYQDQNRLELSFPSTKIEDFYKNDLATKLSNVSIIKSVSIVKKSKPIPRVVVNLIFHDSSISSGKNVSKGKGRYIIRWNKVEDLEGHDGRDSFRLILDIFTKESLEELKKDKAMILLAKNEKKKNVLTQQQLKKKFRIILDVGHGGKDPGSIGFLGLKEKNVTLDLARRTRNLLCGLGFNVYLTRSQDKTLSLLQRSELAANLKADLFVSLHVNSAGILNKINGIETYYLKESSLNQPHGFLVLSPKSDYDGLTNFVESFFFKRRSLSKQFACNLQSGLVSFLKKKGINVVDRGIKKSLSRVLLRSEVPAALVEVGFLTNKQEAKRLATSSYRQLLALGISSGISNYIRKFL